MKTKVTVAVLAFASLGDTHRYLSKVDCRRHGSYKNYHSTRGLVAVTKEDRQGDKTGRPVACTINM